VLKTPQPTGDDMAAAGESVSDAVHRFLGRTHCMLAMTRLDNLFDEHEPVNVSATSSEHSNWRRKYSFAIENLMPDHPAWQLVEAMRAQRRTGAIGTLNRKTVNQHSS
jgi:4-alpha-glucanotransferase